MNQHLDQLFSMLNSLWQRRGQALAVIWAISLLGWSFVIALPDTYHASARVYVDTMGILQPLLKGLAVDSNIAAEVELMERTLLSRPNLAKVARMTDLDLTVSTPIQSEELLVRLERQIEVRRAGPNLFSISYSDLSGQKAHDVVQALLTIFVENNLGQNRRDMDTARRFIEEQIEDYESKLELAEGRLAQFKQKHLDHMSGQDGYRQQFRAAKSRLAAAEAELRDAKLRRDTLRQELQTIPQFFESTDGEGVFGGPPSDLMIRILDHEQTMEDLLTRFTENHPDVIRTKRRLDVLRQQYQSELESASSGPGGPASSAGPGSGIPNTVYEQVKVSLVNEQARIGSLEQQLVDAQAKHDDLVAMAVQVPVIEAELTKLNRDYNVLKTKYEELLSRREAERISRARELEAESVQFRIIEPPVVPVAPSGPNRVLLLALALAVGIGSGGAFAFLLFLSSDAITNVSQLREAFAGPVLGVVSSRNTPEERGWQTAKTLMFGLGVCFLLAVFAGLMLVEYKVGWSGLLKSGWLAQVPIRW